MSTDYHLYSQSHNKRAMVGSVGLGGVKVWSTEYGGKEFLAWAIENNIRDAVLVDENRLEALMDGANSAKAPTEN